MTKIPFGNSEHVHLDVARVRWSPWGDRAVTIDTMMIPPADRWPDWHIRVHRIRINKGISSLHMVEGGFAIYGRRAKDGLAVVERDISADAMLGEFEGTLSTSSSTFVASKDGISGIVTALRAPGKIDVTTSAMKPDSNTNLARQRTLIPVASFSTRHSLPAGTELFVVSCIFAISATANNGWTQGGPTIKQRWLQIPSIDLDALQNELN
jgi:hypothetical protein